MVRWPGTILALATLAALPVTAQPTGTPVPYHLQGASTYVAGCLDGPCRCQVSSSLLAGTFSLRSLGGVVRAYAVDDVKWFTHQGGAVLDEITGGGGYLIDGDHHRMLLELRVNGGPPFTVDSGFAPRGPAFPTIDVTALTDGPCFREGVAVAATPALDSIELVMPDPTVVAWTVTPGVAAWDVVLGDLGTLRATGGDFAVAGRTCIGDGVSAPSLEPRILPAPGAAFWILVRGASGPPFDSAGRAQTSSRDAQILASPGSCP